MPTSLGLALGLPQRGLPGISVAGGGPPPPVGHLYWRLSTTANNGHGQFIGFTEFILASVLGGPNRADFTQLSAAPSTDQFAEGTQTNMNNAKDGVLSNAWLWNYASGNVHWFQFRFAAPIAIVEYGLTCCTNGSTQPVTCMPRDFSLAWSDNGSAFTTVNTQAGSTGWSLGQTRRWAI